MQPRPLGNAGAFLACAAHFDLSRDGSLAMFHPICCVDHRGELMHKQTCPRCGASGVVQRLVNNRFRASDPGGQVFEVTLQEPIWSCPTCQMGWEGEDTLAAKENAYQAALTMREAKTCR